MKQLLSLLLGSALMAVTSHAQNMQTRPTDPWNDPAFVKSFLGSYGFLADYEPHISDTEKDTLRALIDPIKDSPRVASQQLEPQITHHSSAAFDFILANLFFQDGKLAKAEKYYTSAIEKHPAFRRAYKNLGLVQIQNRDFKKAIPTISKALELGVVDGRAYGLLGYSYLTLERYYPAEAAYRQAILMQPDVTDWKLGLARCLLETQRDADAIALFDTLLKDDPNNPNYWLLQANAYLGKGESLKAAQNIEIVLRMGAAQLTSLTLLGDIYMNHQSPDLALSAYLEAVKIANSSDIKSILRSADLLTRSGNFEQAHTMIARTREQFTRPLHKADDLKLLTLEAKIARAQGHDEAAVASLHQIIERDALNGDALIELANYYAEQGDLPRAINRYEQAEKIEAFERQSLIAHAQARVRSKQYREALPLLRRALRLQPDSTLEDYAQRVQRAARNHINPLEAQPSP